MKDKAGLTKAQSNGTYRKALRQQARAYGIKPSALVLLRNSYLDSTKTRWFHVDARWSRLYRLLQDLQNQLAVAHAGDAKTVCGFLLGEFGRFLGAKGVSSVENVDKGSVERGLSDITNFYTILEAAALGLWDDYALPKLDRVTYEFHTGEFYIYFDNGQHRGTGYSISADWKGAQGSMKYPAFIWMGVHRDFVLGQKLENNRIVQSKLDQKVKADPSRWIEDDGFVWRGGEWDDLFAAGGTRKTEDSIRIVLERLFNDIDQVKARRTPQRGRPAP